MRCAIYARYSSDKQSETSAEDQVRLCRQRAESQGWDVVDVFTDEAMSGARRDRPALTRLLAKVAEFDLVLAESIDRLSRDQEDIAAIHKRLAFAGVRLVTIADGEVGKIHIGLKGTMAALFLEDLAQKTRRGMAGRVAAGRIPGGLSYGYRRLKAFDAKGEPERGLREIDEAEAMIVRRIFDEWLQGISPRAIAQRLNAEHIPAPAGGLWRASTIVGSRQRGNGILHNALYAGRIVFNRQRFERHPDTRRRIAKLNPREAWQVEEVPALRIVDEATWAAVQARHEATAHRPAHAQRRPRKLLSGLLACGFCGGTVTIRCADQWGCANHRETGTCSNNRLTTNASIEKRVLGALKHRLLSPQAVEEYVREFHRHQAKALARAKADQGEARRRMREAEKKIARWIEAIGDGTVASADIREQLHATMAERDAMKRQLGDLGVADVIPLHPKVADSYRARIAELGAALAGPEAVRHEARQALRALIDTIVVHPREGAKGVDLEVHGRLAEIIAFARHKKKGPAEAGPDHRDYSIRVVAGARTALWRAVCTAIV